MPKEIVDKLAQTFETAFNDPAVQKQILIRNSIPYFSSPDQTLKYLNGERKVYERVLEKVGTLKKK
jgi:tripartite-type tricarboxylate transporter receptor subunit TctC